MTIIRIAGYNNGIPTKGSLYQHISSQQTHQQNIAIGALFNAVGKTFLLHLTPLGGIILGLSRNLFSTPQFFGDNSYSFLFSPNIALVHTCRGNLYPTTFWRPSHPGFFRSVCTFSSPQHHHLDHSSTKVLTSVQTRFQKTFLISLL